MRVALRALVLLAAVTPLFVATGFRPAWWQTLAAAAFGSALGQLAVWLTRERRVVQWAVAGVAASVVVVAAAWPFVHRARREASSGPAVLVVSGETLTWDDLHAMQTLVPSVERAVPYRQAPLQLICDDQNWQTRVVGTTNDYFDLMEAHLAEGERFGDTTAKVVVLGETVATNLFGAHGNPLGQIVRIKNIPFEVIGELAHRGMSAQGQDLDDVALVPLDVFSQKLAPSLRSRLGGTVLISPVRAEAEVRSLLRDRHLLAPGTDDDFKIRAVGE